MKRETILRMTREILDIADKNISVSGAKIADIWPNIVIKTTNRKGRSFGGRRDRLPFMSIAMKSCGWDCNTVEDYERKAKAWADAAALIKPGYRNPKVTKWNNAYKRVNLREGEGFWMEYPAIAKDPEIGNLYGDASDNLKPLAALLCHEIAHVIDYNCGALTIGGKLYEPYGSSHGTKWREIYRVLRNAYVKSGAYLPTKVVKINRKTASKDMRLVGLPLFDLAA